MKKITIFFALFLIAFSMKIYAIKAYPYPITETLPDGSQFTYHLKGDEYFRYKTTTDGYLLKRNSEGFYEYAKYDSDKKIKSTGIRANNIDKRSSEETDALQKISPNIDFTQANIDSRIQKSAALTEETNTSLNDFPKTGSPKSLVILVNFKDKSFVVNDPKTSFTNLLNQVGYSDNEGTGSARDYFISSSFGQVSPSFDVVGPYTLPSAMNVYGANDATENDIDPRQMVIDACNLADNDVNFANYDLDNDGVIDNVFIYYAGYNEAEGGAETTIWPHRWAVTTTVKLDNKRLFGYACTSELSGATGSNMCGIGTFCHEFGHVFGLKDYYPTDGGTHQTLTFWNIMDAGSYLNGSRTPPTYSAYDRFYLGWLTPTILSQSATRILSPLQENNKAYIITKTGTHNLVGSNPNPVEFFTLENRQKNGWDAYLPYHGMLITRINYDAGLWNENAPNNIATAMRVDLIEADGYATTKTYTGDPFPGTAKVISYIPQLMDGTKLSNYPINAISEVIGGNISFDFMGGGIVPLLTTTYSNTSTYSCEYQSVSDSKEYTIGGYNLIDSVRVSFEQGENFEMKLESATEWSKSIKLGIPIDSTLEDTKILVRFSPVFPEFSQTLTDNLVFTSENAESKTIALSGTINSDDVTLFKNFDEQVKVYKKLDDIIIDLREKTNLEFPITVRAYNAFGQQLYNYSVSTDFHIITGLPKYQLIILDIDGYSIKFL